ncbi:MATE family efflux transporter [Hominifimenecus sp. rT4P-3]|uniref:MATE family efflux transporter n=1 Tax=Hominifimenecus sp. rT4P-3 TaxID=3242979 RepID=UPI003DA2D849
MKKSGYEMDMCTGSLWKKILVFSVPLMFSNVLQILFNMADVAVVGKFAGPKSLGAVGSTSILIALTTGIMLGMSSGVNAIAALHIGANEEEKVRKTVHTSILICFFLGVMILIAGLLGSRSVLLLMNTKDELIEGAVLYLKIYLLGSPALALYNYGNAILSAVGDTRRPLMYLCIAGVINVILNLFFVIVLRMDVLGVALASIISQYISAFLVLRCLMRRREAYGLRISQIRLNREIAMRVLHIGVPSAVQYSLFMVANLFVQTAVNSFDHVVVEGNAAALNADNLVYEMMAAFYTACTSFIAQNYGAGQKKRILQTYGITTLYAFSLAAVLGGLLVLFRVSFLSLFTSDSQVIQYGGIRMVIMGLSYSVSAFMDNAVSAARGIGKSVIPTILVISGTLVFRLVWIYTIFAWFHTLESLYLLYIFAWIFTALVENLYLFFQFRKIQFIKNQQIGWQ